MFLLFTETLNKADEQTKKMESEIEKIKNDITKKETTIESLKGKVNPFLNQLISYVLYKRKGGKVNPSVSPGFQFGFAKKL